MEKILALESTVIAHGLPKPINVEVALELEKLAREKGCAPKTIGIVEGEIKVGLSEEEIQKLGTRDDVLKVGVAEIPYAVAKRLWAATTVSATMRIASKYGIKIFATGGIGGVHSTQNWDVSQDLLELSRTRMIVVSAGPKSILDLKATMEMLESLEVTVVGFRTDKLPAFYLRCVDVEIKRVETVEEIVRIFKAKERLDLPGSLLVFNPIPEEYAIDERDLQEWEKKALEDLQKAKITGKDVTPFLLAKLAEYSSGKTVESNIALLKNNVSLACDILNCLFNLERGKTR
ncbi:pseudouridine-5'-phosphate glycosidase [Pseudothermotoga thermarum]|uniref:Pseudouridine-5'-phosphate glycosidase n=1 Tax=Pseudothermotoga thermarum DSM 5069 TaxID=688269 RepID=F7YTS1_9THEM|nr:pseudouridine-5'-phosphate glycosidase [Pseudothermotoga thermarum]AEH51366.1 Indigoidine synthase A family protein [Pseudothermotoga thermarum DSM 5069]